MEECDNCKKDQQNNLIFCSLNCRNKYFQQHNKSALESLEYRCRICSCHTVDPYGNCGGKYCKDRVPSGHCLIL